MKDDLVDRALVPGQMVELLFRVDIKDVHLVERGRERARARSVRRCRVASGSGPRTIWSLDPAETFVPSGDQARAMDCIPLLTAVMACRSNYI